MLAPSKEQDGELEDGSRKKRLSHATASLQTTLAAAALDLAAQSAKFSMEQQLYVAQHLDYLTMVIGDGAAAGSFGQPYWCSKCCWVPIAIGVWLRLGKQPCRQSAWEGGSLSGRAVHSSFPVHMLFVLSVYTGIQLILIIA